MITGATTTTMAANRGTREDWREHALQLGVNPDEPDDWVYFQSLERAEKLVESFRYHQPGEGQIGRIAEVRQSCIAAAKVILRCSVECADQTAALRKLHEAMMTTNKAIVCEVIGIRR